MCQPRRVATMGVGCFLDGVGDWFQVSQRVTDADREAATSASAQDEAVLASVKEAVAFCLRPRNVRRTARIALIVGILLTLINQGAVIASGHETAATWVRCGLNFVVPFLVSNAGLLSGHR